MEMPLVNIMDLIPKDGLATADGIAELLYNISAKQQSADLAILRAERLKEAEWLEEWVKKCREPMVADMSLVAANIEELWGKLQAHIASLKGDGEGQK